MLNKKNENFCVSLQDLEKLKSNIDKQKATVEGLAAKVKSAEAAADSKKSAFEDLTAKVKSAKAEVDSKKSALEEMKSSSNSKKSADSKKSSSNTKKVSSEDKKSLPDGKVGGAADGRPRKRLVIQEVESEEESQGETSTGGGNLLKP